MGNLIEQEQVVFNGNAEFNESEESDDSYDSQCNVNHKFFY